MDTIAKSLKKLPFGLQNFAEIIYDNYLYVDKTRHIHTLVTKGKNYFLSRPRRFGKTLLLSALKALFSGPPDRDGPPAGLFQDLWIGGAGFVFPERHPIISLSMASAGRTNEILNTSILKALNKINLREDLGLSVTLLGDDFSTIIESLSQKYNKKVVILIDEYDEPVSSNLHNISLALENRDILKDFYSGLKTAEEYTRFTFVTGVTRYAFMGLSAGLNHLNDITLNEKYANICGFTHDELDKYFSAYFPQTLVNLKNDGAISQETTLLDLRKRILSFYDGYSWDAKTRVVNPYSLMKFFEESAFIPYWKNLEPSTDFLYKVISNYTLDLLPDQLQNLTQGEFGVAEVGGLAPVAALFQTGYLTVDTIAYSERGEPLYKFKTPNEEIRPIFEQLFKNNLFSLLNKDPLADGIKFKQILDSGDATKITEIMTSLYSSVPAKHHRDEESFYHGVLHAYCWGILEFPPLSELSGGVGTPDIILFFDDGLYVVIELKYLKPDNPLKPETDEATLKEILENLATLALKSIEKKKYANAYLSRAQKLSK
ncbi:MAG: AAA family ATPase [Deltaproteobacteria bacterium]|jgi:hypothetical protein|nr:AAA family ATPase [Deltaproteobacteria bacterium]